MKHPIYKHKTDALCNLKPKHESTFCLAELILLFYMVHKLLLRSILLQKEDKSVMYTRLEGSLFANHHDIHRDMSYSYCLNWHFHQLLT
jgi:hypothetical protein